MRKLIASLLVMTFLVLPLVAGDMKTDLTIDVSKDARASTSFRFFGGTLGIKSPLRTGANISIELLESNLPSGAMPLMPGLTISDYVLRMFCSEESGTALADHSGNDNTITGATDATNYTSASGVGGHGFSLDGSADYGTRADDADFDFDATTDFAVGMWFKHGTITTSADVMWNKADGTGQTQTGYTCRMADDGTLAFYQSDDGGATSDITVTTAEYDDDLWYHVWFVRDASANNYIYVNGVQAGVTAVSAAAATLANTAVANLGTTKTTTGLWDGELDSVEIISGTAPSAQQILQHYALAVAALDVGSVKAFDGAVTAIGTVAGATGTASEYFETDALSHYRGWVRLKSSATQAADETIKVFYIK